MVPDRTRQSIRRTDPLGLALCCSQDKPAVASLVKYLLSKLEPSSPFHSQLSQLLQAPVDASTPAAPKHVGLVLSERMVNMPTQIVPPMYRMLQEELQWATEDVRPKKLSDCRAKGKLFGPLSRVLTIQLLRSHRKSPTTSRTFFSSLASFSRRPPHSKTTRMPLSNRRSWPRPDFGRRSRRRRRSRARA